MLGNIAASAADTGLSAFDWLNLFAASTSIVLAIVALALSIFFFVQGKNSAERSERSAAEISSNVNRLETLFDRLYSDTFSMMRETVTDMRQHVWKIAPGQGPAEDEKLKELEAKSQAAVLDELDKVSRKVGLADAKVGELRAELAPVLKRALEEQREIVEEVSNSQVESEVLDLIRNKTVSDVRYLEQRLPYSREAIVRALFRLRQMGIIQWGDGGRFTMEGDPIRFIPVGQRTEPNHGHIDH